MKARAALLALSAGTMLLRAQEPIDLQILPPSIQLDSARDGQRVVALGRTAGGITRDLSAEVQWRVEGDAAELLRDDGVRLRARADGECVLVAEHGTRSARVPVRVRGAALTPQVSFTNEVLPILTRSGCNAGSCHGAAAGKEGFGLSLFAYDPGHDHFALTRQLRGRRIDPAQPAQSLMLQKSGGLVPHRGGKKLPADGALHADVRAWIADGAADDRTTAAALQSLEVLPAEAVLLRGSRLPLQVRARYADGSDRDVTTLALWSSSNDGAASVAGDGAVAALDAGEAAILARFAGQAITAQVLVLRDDAPFAWPDVPAVNFVDTAVHGKLQKARVVPAALCDDATFVRRVHLDLIGLLPSPDAVRAFVADAAAEKRARAIDALLERPEFAAVQAMAWAEVLRIDNERMEPKGATLLAQWLRDQLAAHRPLDAVVHELLTAEGPTFASAPANFWLAAEQPNVLAEHVAQNFLGVRLQCAQCHNHPFENWTMDDYYGFAAFFAQLSRKRAEDGAEWIVWNRGNGDMRHKRDNSVAAPRLLGGREETQDTTSEVAGARLRGHGESVNLKGSQTLGGGPAAIPAQTDRRRVLADWLVRSPAFARNVVNRLWARLLGRGLVDPPDDVRISNPASHPQLLQELADLLVAEHFDIRPVVRAICNSRTYQLAAQVAAQPSEPATPPAASLFAAFQVRRLAAEPLLDAIAAVTGVPTRYPGVPLGGAASAIASGRTNVRFLDVFGRPARDSACTCDRRDEPTLGQALHLIAGDTIAQKIANPQGRLQQALQRKDDPGAMLDELFLAAYARLPNERERARLLASLASAKDDDALRAEWRDIAWAVLNSKEFLFQH